MSVALQFSLALLGWTRLGSPGIFGNIANRKSSMMTTMRAAIYCRISLDQGQDGLGVQRQEEDCRAKAEALGWNVAEVYVDNDMSAFKEKERPAYNRLMDDLRSGERDALVVYDLDRLTRKPRELEDFIDLAEKHGVFLANVSGDVDITTHNGRMIARIKGAVARQEAERTGARIKRQKAQRAAQGHAQGGKWRVYGYGREWNVIEAEAVIVKEMFTRRAKGESFTSIAKDLSGRGLKTVAGKPWSSGTLARVFDKPGYCGRRLYNGEIIGKTAYDPIVSESLFDRVQAVQGHKSPGSAHRKHLLTGILVCSKCNTTMGGINYRKQYKCNQNLGGCGSCAVKIEWADFMVFTEVSNYLSKKPVRNEEDEEVFQAKLDKIDEKIAELEDAYDNEQMPLGTMTRLVNKQQKRRDAILKEQSEKPIEYTVYAANLEEFNRGNLQQKRAHVRKALKHIILHSRETKGPGQFEPNRFEFFWQDGTRTRGWHDRVEIYGMDSKPVEVKSGALMQLAKTPR